MAWFRKQRTSILYFSGLWIVSVALQLYLATHFRGYVGDQMIFVSWMNELQQTGFAHIYQSNQVNYPPVYLLVLDIYGKAANALHYSIQPGALSAKLPGITLDAAAMIAFFVMTAHTASKWRMFILTLFCLNPAIIFDTAVWGQVDVLDGMLSLLAIANFLKRPGTSGFLFAVSLLSKFQSIVIFPVLAVVTLRGWLMTKRSASPVRIIVGFCLAFCGTGLFLAWHGTFFAMMKNAYLATTAQYPYLDMNAMNIWFYLVDSSPHLPDSTAVLGGVTYKIIGLFLLFLATLYMAVYIWRSAKLSVEQLIKAGTIVSFAFYMLPTEIHERYILMAVIFAIAASLHDRKWTWIAAGLTLTSFCNLWTVCYGEPNPTTDMWMVYLNCILFIVMLLLAKKEFSFPRSWHDLHIWTDSDINL